MSQASVNFHPQPEHTSFRLPRLRRTHNFFRNSSAQFSSLAGPKARDRVQTMPIRAPTAGRGLLIRFCQTLLRPLLALDRFPAPAAPATLPEATGRLSAGAYCQTAVSSDVLPPGYADGIPHASLLQRLVN